MPGWSEMVDRLERIERVVFGENDASPPADPLLPGERPGAITPVHMRDGESFAEACDRTEEAGLAEEPTAPGSVIVSTPWLDPYGSIGWGAGPKRDGKSQWYACRQPIMEKGGVHHLDLRIHLSEMKPPDERAWRTLYAYGLMPGLDELTKPLGWGGYTQVWWWFEQR